MYENNNKSKFKLNKYIVLSSLLFLIPSFIALQSINLIYFSILYLITTIASINYWIYPINGIRRNIDLIFGRLSFIITVICGILFIKNRKILILGYFLIFGIILCYYYSNKFGKINSNYWCLCNFLMHIFICIGMIIVILSLKKYLKTT